MTEVLISEITRPKECVQLKTESVQMPRTMAQLFKFEGPFRFLIRRAINQDDQHAGTTGDVSPTQSWAISPLNSNTLILGGPAPKKGE